MTPILQLADVPLMRRATTMGRMRRQSIVIAIALAACSHGGAVQHVNDQFVKTWSQRIAGHENEPAEKVFKNIQWLKNVPASTFLNIMDIGYRRALGVTCTHCHVETDFASDDKRPKRAAREMAVMHRSINDQLRKMQNLTTDSDKRSINCTFCHRGMINPNAPKASR
jgi:hypothetical protein